MTQPVFINFDPNEYIERLCYYPFTVNLSRCMESCNTLNDLPNNVFQTKQKLNLVFFNMITGLNESKILAKHISC